MLHRILKRGKCFQVGEFSKMLMLAAQLVCLTPEARKLLSSFLLREVEERTELEDRQLLAAFTCLHGLSG